MQVPGAVRLLLELVILGFGGYALATAWRPATGIAFVGLVSVHCALARKRLVWLLRK